MCNELYREILENESEDIHEISRVSDDVKWECDGSHQEVRTIVIFSVCVLVSKLFMSDLYFKINHEQWSEHLHQLETKSWSIVRQDSHKHWWCQSWWNDSRVLCSSITSWGWWQMWDPDKWANSIHCPCHRLSEVINDELIDWLINNKVNNLSGGR